jgi:hypothetical protein
MSTNNPSDSADREKAALLAAYASVFSTSDGELILNNLVLFCQNIPDPLVRAGTQDLLLHILRMRVRGADVVKPRSVVGRASTQPRSITTSEE